MMKFYEIPDSLSAEIDELEGLIKKYRQGDLEAAKLKAHRVPFGVYEQRKDDTYMARIRCTGGGITPRQLKKIAELANRYGADIIHITTRQELQIHDLRLEDVPQILRELLPADLSTRGGGGNTVRNIMASWNAGIAPDEPFDVTPYAVSLTSMLIREADSWTLPRKFKISFSNTEKDNAHSVFNDVGFIACKDKGVEGFQVYVAGGMGAKPQVGHVLHSFIPAHQVYRVVEAIKKVFDRHGNRKNKHAARLRFLWNKLGEERFRELYEGEFQALGAVSMYNVTAFTNETAFSGSAVRDESAAFALWRKRFVSPQRQPGLCSILLPVPLGNLPCEQAIKLADLLEPFGENVLRCTMEQNLTVRNIPEDYLGNIYHLVQDCSDLVALPKLFSNGVACTGANTCKLGICLPRGALLAVNRKLKTANLDLDALGDFRLNISGCPNSCGAHPKADLGFYGQVGRKDQRMYPAYGIVAGARIGGDAPRLATRVDNISARDLPQFVLDFLSGYLEKKNHYPDPARYIDGEGRQDIRAICDKYREIPDFNDDKNYYFDWGAEEIFSLVGKGMGECSAGLFDLIDVDLNTIKEKQRELTAQEDAVSTGELLYQITLSAARMLLITQGVEAHSDDEVFDCFIKYFVNCNLIEKRFLPLLEQAKGRNTALLPSLKQDIADLAEAVERLYAGMDDSLKFHPVKEAVAESGAPDGKVAPQPEEKPVIFKDLRGVSCPMNFVKTKMELARIARGQLLRILLDDGEPINSVPRSVAEEGHRIAEQTRVDDYWTVLIEKK